LDQSKKDTLRYAFEKEEKRGSEKEKRV
jgi:hypothetical protein